MKKTFSRVGRNLAVHLHSATCASVFVCEGSGLLTMFAENKPMCSSVKHPYQHHHHLPCSKSSSSSFKPNKKSNPWRNNLCRGNIHRIGTITYTTTFPVPKMMMMRLPGLVSELHVRILHITADVVLSERAVM